VERSPFAAERGPLPPVAVINSSWAPTLSFAYSLGRKAVPLHFYGPGAGRWSRYCSRHESCPSPEDADAFMPWLADKIRSGAIARLAPTTDQIAYYASALRDLFPEPVRRSIPTLDEIEGCLIKTRFAQRCAAGGCPTPATADADGLETAREAARRFGYPVILKPKSHLVVGTRERGVVVNDDDELRGHYRPYGVAAGHRRLAVQYPELVWPLLQKFVPSARTRVYSVTGLRDPATGIVAAAASYKGDQWPVDVGTSTLQVACTDAAVLRAGIRVAEQCVSTGLFEVELLLGAAGELLAIDLNPRGFGFIGMEIERGFDLPWLWYQSTQGPVAPVTVSRSPETVEARPPMVALWVPLGSTARACAGFLRGERHRSARVRRVSMLGHVGDPLPMILSNLAFLRHPRDLLRAQMRSLQQSLAARRDPVVER
jgi:D-aspartate ligase